MFAYYAYVKDLGRALGQFVVVAHCTAQTVTSDLTQLLRGICQGGLWGCFISFNKTPANVLSTVAAHFSALAAAKRAAAVTAKGVSGKDVIGELLFPGGEVLRLHSDAACFATLCTASSCSSRVCSDLPENLKVQC
jgi:Hydrolytic ATP binding site of dynein motor region